MMMGLAAGVKSEAKLIKHWKIFNLFGIVLILIWIVHSSNASYEHYYDRGYSHDRSSLTANSFHRFFEDYFSANTYLTSEQREQYEEYWNCLLSGRTEHILKSLQWQAKYGWYDDYFMALNYLVYLHDQHFKNPRLLQIIEELIDRSVQQNIIQSSVLLTKSVTYNIIKYLLDRFRPNVEPVQRVEYSVLDFQAPSHEDISRLIAVLGPNTLHPRYYALMVSYLRNLPSLVYQQLDFKQEPKTCLKQIITLLLNGSFKISRELKHACYFYLQIFKKQETEYYVKQRNIQIVRQLINFVPNFNSTYRTVLLDFLTSGTMVHDLVRLVGHPVASESYLYNLLIKGMSYPNLPTVIREACKFYVSYFHKLNIFVQQSQKIPQFINSPGKEYYHLLTGFIKSTQFRSIISTTGFTHLNIELPHLLQNILALLKSNYFVPVEVQKAAKYTLDYFDIISVKQKYSLDTLFSIIPYPTIRSEMVHYNNIKELFESVTFLQIVKQKNLQIVSDHRVMLHEVLNCALESTSIDLDFKEAILHYFKYLYEEGLTTEEELKIEILLQELKSVQIETTYYEVICKFLRSDLAYLVFQNHRVDFTQSSFIVLEEIFQIMTKMEYLEVTIINAASYCKTEIHKVYESETTLITKIHQAFTSLQGVSTKIVEKYQKELNVFLQCEEMHTIIRHSHFDISKDARELLYEVLLVLEEDINVSMVIREGAYHYCKYILEPLLGNVPCDMEALLALLPQPSDHVTHQYFNSLKMYLQHGVPRFLVPQIDFTKTNVNLLLEILQALVYSDQIPVDIRGTARYYWHFFNTDIQANVKLLINKLDRFTLLLPKPVTIHETQYYNLMVGFLHGEQILKLLNTISINMHKSDISILRDILVLTLNTNLIHMDTKIVAKYYLNMIDTGAIRDVSMEQHIVDFVHAAVPAINSSISVVAPTEATIVTVHEIEHRPIFAVDTTHAETVKTTGITSAAASTTAQASATHVIHSTHSSQATSASSAVHSSSATQTLQATKATTSTAQAAVAHTSNSSSVSKISEAITTTSITSTLTVQQITVLHKIETALTQMEVGSINVEDRNILQTYLKTPTAYTLLETSGVNLEDTGSNLLANFVEIAAHTNDIPQEVRLASERYEMVIPSLKASLTLTPHKHLVVLDGIFHKITKATIATQSQNVVLCYNAIDRYLHTPVPSSILQGSSIDLKIAPLEVLRDMLLVTKECSLATDDIVIVQNLIQQNVQTFEVLEHLYKLHKVFQLLELPTQNDCLEYYYTMDTFLRSDTCFTILQTKKIDFNQDLREILKSILSVVMNTPHDTITISHDVIKAAVYFNGVMFKPSFSQEMDVVFHLLPIPVVETELQAFNTVNEFIHSSNAAVLTDTINLDTHRNPSMILANVLDLASHNSKVSADVRHAAQFLLSTKSFQTTTEVQTSKKVQYTHSSVHSMKSLTTSSTTTSRYVSLLNILPTSYTATADFTVLKTYFENLTLVMTNEFLALEMTQVVKTNEEGLLRLILQKITHTESSPENVRTVCSRIIKQRYFDYSVFVSLIPVPAFTEEETYHSLVTTLFTSDQIYRYAELVWTDYETNFDSLKIILGKLSTCEQLSLNIRQACTYYYSHAPFFDYSSLINLIPDPTGNNIAKLYTTLVNFFSKRELVNRCTLHINAVTMSSNALLREVLVTAEKSEWLDESIRVAAKYYLTRIKSVSVSLKKVLTKTMDLSDIFTDAFDFSSFTRAQFDAYHDFWTYVSGRTQELLSSSGFDFWMHSNKRGEFTSKFLEALGKHSGVPSNILNDVHILMPLVHLDEGGALDI